MYTIACAFLFTQADLKSLTKSGIIPNVGVSFLFDCFMKEQNYFGSHVENLRDGVCEGC